MTLEEKIDELTSLVRALDTKISFIDQDINELKEGFNSLGDTMVTVLKEGVGPKEPPKNTWVMEKL